MNACLAVWVWLLEVVDNHAMAFYVKPWQPHLPWCGNNDIENLSHVTPSSHKVFLDDSSLSASSTCGGVTMDSLVTIYR